MSVRPSRQKAIFADDYRTVHAAGLFGKIWTFDFRFSKNIGFVGPAPPLAWQNLGFEWKSGIGEAWRVRTARGSARDDCPVRVGGGWLRIAIERRSRNTYEPC